jgi:DnaJ-class molecular chaperone
MPKNLYNTLGVAKDASSEEIKKSYRALSLKYHPDRNTDPSATDLYKEINEAYEILSDPQKRQQYDMGGMDFVGHPGGGGPGSDMNDINQLFNMMFGGGGGMPGMGMPFSGGMPGMGDMPEIHIFHGGMGGGGRFRQQMMKPQALQKTVQITLEQLYNGDTIPFEYECWTIHNGMRVTEIKTIQVTIPQGIHPNERMVLQRMGNSAGENNTGDLVLGFEVAKHALFEREDMDLVLHKKISLKDALCGFSFEIRHLNGKTLYMNNLTNHTIIRPNYRKHIPNLGMVKNGHTGDLVIVFEVEFPETLSAEVIEQIRGLL